MLCFEPIELRVFGVSFPVGEASRRRADPAAHLGGGADETLAYGPDPVARLRARELPHRLPAQCLETDASQCEQQHCEHQLTRPRRRPDDQRDQGGREDALDVEVEDRPPGGVALLEDLLSGLQLRRHAASLYPYPGLPLVG